MLQEIKKHLQRIIDDIDAGNSNLQEKDLEILSDTLVKIGERRLSEEETRSYLNISRSMLYKLIDNGKLPKGIKQRGFKEVFWLKSDIDKYLKLKDN